MKKKPILLLAALAAAAYAIYAGFFLERTALGELCSGSAMCEGECLGFGDLLPDYSHQEICTRQCESEAECGNGTSCVEVQVYKLDGKTTEPELRNYCLPTNEQE